jgi:hypothetical protein
MKQLIIDETFFGLFQEELSRTMLPESEEIIRLETEIKKALDLEERILDEEKDRLGD